MSDEEDDIGDFASLASSKKIKGSAFAYLEVESSGNEEEDENDVSEKIEVKSKASSAKKAEVKKKDKKKKGEVSVNNEEEENEKDGEDESNTKLTQAEEQSGSKQQSKGGKKDKQKKGGKEAKGKQKQDDDIDALLAEIEKPKEAGGGKKKKKKGGKADDDNEITAGAVEPISAPADPVIVDLSKMTEEEIARAMGLLDDDEDEYDKRKKKGKKKKGAGGGEAEVENKKDEEKEEEKGLTEDGKGEAEEEGTTAAKSTAEKKKEKKQRQKEQAQQSKGKDSKPASEPVVTPATKTSAEVTAGPAEKAKDDLKAKDQEESEEAKVAGDEEATNDFGEEIEEAKGVKEKIAEGETAGEASKKKKDKKKKKGKEAPAAEEKEEKTKQSKIGKLAQEALKRRKELEEKYLREQEEKERKIEQALLEKEEQERKEKERRERMKVKKKEKTERLKTEGKYMTPAQRQAMKIAQEKLRIMKEQCPGTAKVTGSAAGPAEKGEGEPKKKIVYERKRPKKPGQASDLDNDAVSPLEPTAEDDRVVESSSEPTVDDGPTENGASIQVVDLEQKDQGTLAPEKDKDNIKASWEDASEDEEDVADSWDREEEEEGSEKRKAIKVSVSKDSISKSQQPVVSSKSQQPVVSSRSQQPVVSSKSQSVEEEEESESDEEDESEDEESESEDEADDATAEEKRREKALKRIKERKETAAKNRNPDILRAPVVCVLGHVDTGKTKILDKLRHTNVQDNEVGGITQQIGATNVPRDAILEQTKMCKEFTKLELKLPGLLIIDTPGHEAFSNLRTRGSSLCDFAILVVDIMHGLENQTIESINLLKKNSTPYIVALNKIDRLFQWQSNPHNDVVNTLKKQKDNVMAEFKERMNVVKGQFSEQGLNVCLFSENKNPSEYISLVPTSAHSGDGMGNLIAHLCEQAQKYHASRLAYSEELQATVMEVKEIPGLGTTLDVILVNGTLREHETIVVAGTDGPIVTQIRSLLLPQPMRELRVKGTYIQAKEIKAAQGVKIIAKNLDHAIAGLPLFATRYDDEVEIYKEEIALVLKDALASFKVEERGVFVQASTLGSLEALLTFLTSENIKYAGINIGPVHKRDVMKASIMLEHDSQMAVILAFDVKIEREAQEVADTLGVRIFTADIIYHLQQQYLAYREEFRKKRQEELKHVVVFPCKLRILPNCVFKSRDPIVVGVSVEAGFVKEGTPICVPSKEFIDIGRITSIEINHKAIPKATKGQEVCIKIESVPGDTPKLVGRHFEETDILVSKISRESIDALKECFREEMSKADWELTKELKKTFDIM